MLSDDVAGGDRIVEVMHQAQCNISWLAYVSLQMNVPRPTTGLRRLQVFWLLGMMLFGGGFHRFSF